VVSTVSTQFEGELKKIIQAEIVRVQDILGVGELPKDFADYKFLTGQLFAYRRVLDSYAEEVNTIISKR
jgi:hypothetical protein